MNEFSESQKNLLQAYQSWRELTVNESAALQGDAWACVLECQSAKSDLQFRILHLTQAIQRDFPSSCGPGSKFENHLRKVLAELIAFEKSNLELIRSRRRLAEKRKKELDRSRMTLGRVHRTYAPSSEMSWSSYS